MLPITGSRSWLPTGLLSTSGKAQTPDSTAHEESPLALMTQFMLSIKGAHESSSSARMDKCSQHGAPKGTATDNSTIILLWQSIRIPTRFMSPTQSIDGFRYLTPMVGF